MHVAIVVNVPTCVDLQGRIKSYDGYTEKVFQIPAHDTEVETEGRCKRDRDAGVGS